MILSYHIFTHIYVRRAKKRDDLLEETHLIYKTELDTDGKAYAAAQKALKNNEEQFFTQQELNKMLPQHLRKDE